MQRTVRLLIYFLCFFLSGGEDIGSAYFPAIVAVMFCSSGVGHL
jgi:hypothetical protein